jgi:hypothetical protein
MFDYYLGLDLGQASDFTAVAVLEESVWLTGPLARTAGLVEDGWGLPSRLAPQQATTARAFALQRGQPGKPPLWLRYLHRFPLGTPYPRIVAAVAEMLHTPPLAGQGVTALALDKTGVGAPVADLFRAAGLAPFEITISGGHTVNVGEHPRELTVPKRDLVSAVQAALQTRRLSFADGLPELDVLRRELETFRVKISAAGHDSYEAWRERDHDDTVLAVALAVWLREWYCEHLDGANTNVRLEA